MAYKSKGTQFANYANPSITSTVSGVSAGDILVYVIVSDVAVQSVSWPADFTPRISQPVGYDGQRLLVATKVAAGTEGALIATATIGGYRACGVCLVYSGEDTGTSPVVGTPGFSSSGNASPITATAPGLSLSAAVTDVLCISMADVGTPWTNYTSTTPPSGFTSRADFSTTSVNLAVSDKQVSGSSVGSQAATITLSSGLTGWSAVLLGLSNLATATVTLGGTILSSTTETDIVNGGKTITLTVNGDTFIT